MVTPELFEYIRASLAAGLSRKEIETALVIAGWASSEIAEAFSHYETPTVAVPPIKTKADMEAENVAEAARIQKELEFEANRKKYVSYYRGATTATPVVGGLIGLLMAKKLAHDEVQANLILLGIMFVCVAFVVWLNWPAGGSVAPQLTPEDLRYFSKPPVTNGA